MSLFSAESKHLALFKYNIAKQLSIALWRCYSNADWIKIDLRLGWRMSTPTAIRHSSVERVHGRSARLDMFKLLDKALVLSQEGALISRNWLSSCWFCRDSDSFATAITIEKIRGGRMQVLDESEYTVDERNQDVFLEIVSGPRIAYLASMDVSVWMRPFFVDFVKVDDFFHTKRYHEQRPWRRATKKSMSFAKAVGDIDISREVACLFLSG